MGEGNDQGKQIMCAHRDGLTPGHMTRHHLIMTGLKSLFEGVTIAYLSRVGPLKVSDLRRSELKSCRRYCAEQAPLYELLHHREPNSTSRSLNLDWQASQELRAPVARSS